MQKNILTYFDYAYYYLTRIIINEKKIVLKKIYFNIRLI